MRDYDHKKLDPPSLKLRTGKKKMTEYNHLKIESKWQKEWEKKEVFQAENNSKKPKFYGLIEFPYPSGAGLHVGHIRSNTAMDIISRKRRMEGFNVLYPIGWDAFGLPTENYAIKTGIHPIKVTKDNTDIFRKQLKALGFSFDWSREINTTDPKYYKWTQWIFLQFFKKGLAYKAKTTINWCPQDKIGLANEEVVGGSCERCGTPVIKKEKEQWMLAITKYADRLDKDLDTVDYLPKIKIQQRNWIGRSEGAEIDFRINSTLALPTSPGLPEGEGKFVSPFGGEFKKGVGEGEMPRYFTTNPELWKALQGKALEMRKNPTNGEKIMWDLLRRNNLSPTLPEGEGENPRGFHFRRQHIVDRFIADFVCIEKKLVVEIDGDIHDYLKSEDQERTEVLNQLGFEVVRFTNSEIIKKPEDVLRKIILKINDISKKVLSFGEDLGGVELAIKVFTTRPDTIFGATYLVLAPEHELVQKLKSQILNWDEVLRYIVVNEKKTEIERTAEDKIKTGIELKGVKAINPVTKEEIPIWIADYVLPHYGTGAIMAVPAHDERDFEFAKKYGLPIKNVIEPVFVEGPKEGMPYSGEGIIANSGKFSGMDSEKAKKEIIKFVGGKAKTTFKLRDWVFSRQRYWGEPIPLVNCAKCGWVPVPEKDLPVVLPKVAKYKPTNTGESPLADIKNWVIVKCPKCKGPAKRETDTMPNWAGSSWYFLRYTDPKNNKEFASGKNLKYWLTTPLPNPLQRRGKEFKASPFGGGMEGVEGQGGVDWYNGGMEHTTLHLLYSRFWHKFLYDLRMVPTSEPYLKRTSHGMILAPQGEKMSKSKGNTVNPDDLIRIYGADTLRMYEMFIGPFDQAVSWNTDSMIGPRRFLERVWKIGERIATRKPKNSSRFTRQNPTGSDATQNSLVSASLSKLLNKTIKKVSEDVEEMRFNTAISSMMILANEMESAFAQGYGVTKKDYKKFLQILSPFAPHIAEELWNMLGEKNSISISGWPKWDKNLIKDEEIKIAVQVNGKVRAEIMIRTDNSEEEIKKKAVTNKTVLRHMAGRDAKKVIYVKNRLVNIVV